jgi:flagellar motility protein MotE (MotC chaperone)
MTDAADRRVAAASRLSRGLRLAAVACALALAGAAVAEQGWDTKVSPEGAKPPKLVQVPVPASATKTVAAPPLPPPAEAKPAKVEPAPAAAKPEPGAAAPKAAPPPRRKVDAAPLDAAVKDYCVNIAAAASDARFLLQKKELASIEAEVAKRMTALDEKIAEYQKWLARRDEFSKKANETVLRIYARMRPDAAASQLAALDDETAAAVIMKLEPRTASLILNDMEPARAARLAATIAGAAKVTPPSAPAATKSGGKAS